MEATAMDMRHNMKDIIDALDRGESVTLLYRGKPRGIIQPIRKAGADRVLEESAAYGLWADREDMADVAGAVRKIRKGRVDDL